MGQFEEGELAENHISLAEARRITLAAQGFGAFEMTPEGIKKESEVDRSQSITSQTGRKLDFMIIGVLIIAVGFLVAEKFRPPRRPRFAG